MLPGKLFLQYQVGNVLNALVWLERKWNVRRWELEWGKQKQDQPPQCWSQVFPQISIGISKLQPLAFKFFLWLLSFKLQVFQEKVFECDQWPFIKIGACKSWLSTTPNIHQCFKLSFFDSFFHGHRMYSCLSTTTVTTSWKKDVVNEQMFVLKIWVRLTVSKLS